MPKPLTGVDRIYVVVTPPCCGMTDAGGFHKYSTSTTGDSYMYVQVKSGGAMNNTFSASNAFTHEVAEAVTDPSWDTTPAWYNGQARGQGEIGDVSGNCYCDVNGNNVQYVWSPQNRALHSTPRMEGGLYQYANGTFSQLYSGPVRRFRRRLRARRHGQRQPGQPLAGAPDAARDPRGANQRPHGG